MNGIDDTVREYQERVRKGRVKKLPDFTDLVEETMEVLSNELKENWGIYVQLYKFSS